MSPCVAMLGRGPSLEEALKIAKFEPGMYMIVRTSLAQVGLIRKSAAIYFFFRKRRPGRGCPARLSRAKQRERPSEA